MNRRDFLQRSAILATGAVAADQLELLDRLGWVRRFFAGWSAPAPSLVISSAQWDSLLRESYTAEVLKAITVASPLLQAKRIPMRDRWVGNSAGWYRIEVARG